MYVVRVRYRARNPVGAIPLLGTLPRYAVTKPEALNPTELYLPPDRTTWEFPVLAQRGTSRAVGFAVRSVVPGASLDVLEVDVRTVELPPASLAFWIESPGGPSVANPADTRGATF